MEHSDSERRLAPRSGRGGRTGRIPHPEVAIENQTDLQIHPVSLAKITGPHGTGWSYSYSLLLLQLHLTNVKIDIQEFI
jgi:hypothetical protein